MLLLSEFFFKLGKNYFLTLISNLYEYKITIKKFFDKNNFNFGYFYIDNNLKEFDSCAR